MVLCFPMHLQQEKKNCKHIEEASGKFWGRKRNSASKHKVSLLGTDLDTVISVLWEFSEKIQFQSYEIKLDRNLIDSESWLGTVKANLFHIPSDFSNTFSA